MGRVPRPRSQIADRQYYRRNKNFSLKGVKRRYNAAGMREELGASIDGLPSNDPTLVMLGATIRSFEKKGIRVLVYTSPINYEHIERVEIDNPDGLAKTLAEVESVARSNGADYLDLHRVMGDPYFRDFRGHFNYQGEHSGSRELARLLAPRVLRLARGQCQGGKECEAELGSSESKSLRPASG
jgi:hypothetical protein